MNKTVILLTMEHSAKLAKNLKEFGEKVYIITLSDELKSKHNISGAISEENLRRMGFDTIYIENDVRLQNISERLTQFFNENENIDVFSLSWHWLISSDFLSRCEAGVVGWHASMFKLPHGFGRSPLNWSIRLGATKVFSNCFLYSSKVDHGPIYYQDQISITKIDHISDLLEKVSAVMLKNIIDIKSLRSQSKKLRGLSRDINTTLGFPKLNHDSGEVIVDDKTLDEISCVIRSCSDPFPGAFIKKNNGDKIFLYNVLSKKQIGCMIIHEGNEFLYCTTNATVNDLKEIPIQSSSKRIEIYKGGTL